MKAIPSADRNTWFCEAGIIAMRNPDGSMQPAVPLFMAVDAADVTSTGITQREDELCEEFGRSIAQKYGEHFRTLHAIGILTQKGK